MPLAAVTAITKRSISGAPESGLGRGRKLQSQAPSSIQRRMLQRTLPAGFIAPCLPTKIDKLPSGSEWPHAQVKLGFISILGLLQD
jgi:hypothetical protein